MNPSETPTPSSGGGSQRKIISPVNEEAVRSYLAENQAQAPAPAQTAPAPAANAQTVPAAEPQVAAPAPTPSSIPVAAATPGPLPAQVAAPQAPPVAQPEIDISKWENRRVATRVQSLQIYAFLIIAYGLYALYTGFSLYAALRSLSRELGYQSSSLPLASYMAFGVAFLYLGVGVYLLLARNIRTVSSVLTVLLIISGLALLNSIISLVRYSSYITASSIVGLAISIGLIVYLYTVKANVDFVRESENA